MTSASSSSATSAPYFRLFDLPQELQDIVFGFAFQHDGTQRIVFKRAWQTEEDERRRRDRSTFVPKPFPALMVEQWLVSRRFFLAASAACFESMDPINNPSQQSTCIEFVFRKGGLCQEFARNLSLDVVHVSGHLIPLVMDEMASFRRLRSLVLVVGVGIFEVLEAEGKFAWQDELGEDEFERVLDATRLGSLTGLEKLHLRPAELGVHTHGLHEQLVFECNLERLDSYARVNLLGAPRPASSPVEGRGWQPLYMGSEVSLLSGPASSPEADPPSWAQITYKALGLDRFGTDLAMFEKTFDNMVSSTIASSPQQPVGTARDPGRSANNFSEGDSSPSLIARRVRGHPSSPPGRQRGSKRRLRDDDIPDTLEEFEQMASDDMEGMFERVQALKANQKRPKKKARKSGRKQ